MRRAHFFKLPRTTRGRVALAAVVIGALLKISLFALPMPRYIARAAWAEWTILRRREPIEHVIAERKLAPNETAKLALVLDARSFALDSLGLPAEKLFTQFSQLDSDTLVLVVSAARRDTLALHTWWFPIVGRVPYKGFFDFEEAQKVAREFEHRGFDTDVRPASAFSTLGWFDDPLLSTTLRQDSISLVNTVLHEMTHNRVFVRSQVDFNESFASWVGSRGSAEYFRTGGDTAKLRTIEARWEDEKARAGFIHSLLTALDSAYTQHSADSLARVWARDSVYARATRKLFDSLTIVRGDSVARRVQQRLRFNNASLLARRVYGRNLALFDSVHTALGANVRTTIDSVVAVARDSREPFDAVRQFLHKRERR